MLTSRPIKVNIFGATLLGISSATRHQKGCNRGSIMEAPSVEYLCCFILYNWTSVSLSKLAVFSLVHSKSSRISFEIAISRCWKLKMPHFRTEWQIVNSNLWNTFWGRKSWPPSPQIFHFPSKSLPRKKCINCVGSPVHYYDYLFSKLRVILTVREGPKNNQHRPW